MKKGVMMPVALLTSLFSMSLTTHAKEEVKPDVLDKVNWEVTSVVDAKGNTVTDENKDLIVLAKYDLKTNHYEFFDMKGSESKEEGTFFITENTIKTGRIFGEKQQLTDIVQLDKSTFTYRTTGKQKDNKVGDVFVVSQPFTEKQLDFTKAETAKTKNTVKETEKASGSSILSKTVWEATKIVNSDNDDVKELNDELLNYAMFDAKTGRYEYFDIKTGKSTKDYGFFDVIRGDKEFVSINHDATKHLEAKVTELDNDRFVYEVEGKDKSREKSLVQVTFEPAKPSEKLEFTMSEAQVNERPDMPTLVTPPTQPDSSTGSSSDANMGSTTDEDGSGSTSSSSSSTSTSTSDNSSTTESKDIKVPKAPKITQPFAGDRVLRGSAETNTKIKLKKSVFMTKPDSIKAEKEFVNVGTATVNSNGQWEFEFEDALAPGEEIEAIAVNIERPEFESKPTYITVKEPGKGDGGDKPGTKDPHNKKPGGTNQNKKPDGTNQNKKPDGKKLPQTGEAVKKTSLIVGVVIIVAVVIGFYMKNKKEKN